jgi:hypothetical protein
MYIIYEIEFHCVLLMLSLGTLVLDICSCLYCPLSAEGLLLCGVLGLLAAVYFSKVLLLVYIINVLFIIWKYIYLYRYFHSRAYTYSSVQLICLFCNPI